LQYDGISSKIPAITILFWLGGLLMMTTCGNNSVFFGFSSWGYFYGAGYFTCGKTEYIQPGTGRLIR
jgi:hypothetical protein